MRPPSGSGVALVMFHFASAAEFRMYSWPPRTRTTGVARRHLVEIAPQREPLLFELRLVPVAVRDDDVAGSALLDPRGHRREHVAQRARARQIDARSAARAVQVVVGEARE